MLSLARTNTSLIGQWWWTVDRWVLAALMLLILFGVLLIMAASPAVADQHHWSSFHFIKKHIIFLIPTLILLMGLSLLSLQDIKWFALGIFGVSLVGLFLTLFMGTEIKGATRWFELGGISIQPSEFVKPSFAIVCAWLFSKQQTEPSFPGNLSSICLYLIVITFLLFQPDLGMTVLITAMWFSQFFLAGLPLYWILPVGGCGIGGLFAAYFLFPHVTRRVDHFLNPDCGDKFGDRYQVNQSLEAFMNGGFLGQGPGEGTVKKYLPDAHADFIFAVAGEEFGMILCLVLVCIFAFILLRTFCRLFDENNIFVVLAVTGLVVQFGLQAVINMASALSLMPTKGMTLPFISYGGSSMLAQAIGMGFVLGLTRRRIGNHE
ncbi:MAG: cell division protein FtsW [Alphaproteobacteria bacterium 41-28]|nr:MAG: cell division protein FtsW [Alphaproteobacteria bacterium 41-28]